MSRAMLIVLLTLGLQAPPLECLVRPDPPEIRLPKGGLEWLPGETSSGRCDPIPDQGWTRGQGGSSDLFVHADGPSGSGRYWTVTLGVGPRGQARPKHGACFTASTVGWRTLQSFERVPLRWVDDLDGDGGSELVVWSSFPLRGDVTPSEFALTAWVYRLASETSLVVDWPLSRRMAREIGRSYRSPLASKDQLLQRARSAAADALEKFADETCQVPRDEGR